MNESESKEAQVRAVIAQASKLITDTTWETNWGTISQMFGFEEEAGQTHRLYRSQSFKDEDYPETVLDFLNTTYEEDSNRALAMIRHIIKDLIENGRLDEEKLDYYPSIEPLLEGEVTSNLLTQMPRIQTVKYLEVERLPGNFYYDLVDELNRCYAYSLTVAVSVLRRKLLENLLVDLLREKFGPENTSLYFDTDHGRFHHFSRLIKNFSGRVDVFKNHVPALDRGFVENLDLFRGVGNSAAHSLEINVERETLKEEKEKFEHAVKMLVRLIQLAKSNE